MRTSLFAFIAIIVAVQSLSETQFRTTIKMTTNSCQAKTKATDEEVQNVAGGIWDNPKSACFVYCFMNTIKLVDKSTGKFNERSAMKQVPLLPEERQEPAVRSMQNCKGSDEGEDKCQVAYNFAKCFYFDNPENFVVA